MFRKGYGPGVRNIIIIVLIMLFLYILYRIMIGRLNEVI